MLLQAVKNHLPPHTACKRINKADREFVLIFSITNQVLKHCFFLWFSLGPGGFRKVQGPGRNHVHLSWHLSDAVVTSYGPKPWGDFHRLRYLLYSNQETCHEVHAGKKLAMQVSAHSWRLLQVFAQCIPQMCSRSNADACQMCQILSKVWSLKAKVVQGICKSSRIQKALAGLWTSFSHSLLSAGLNMPSYSKTLASTKLRNAKVEHMDQYDLFFEAAQGPG